MRLILVFAFLLFLVGSELLVERGTERRLLRSEPVALVADGDLRAFALRRGAALYQWHCGGCHGVAGKGNSTAGVADLTDRDWLYGSGSIADIELVVTYGIRSAHPKTWNLAIMPAYGREVPSPKSPQIKALTPDEIGDLIELIDSSQGLPADTERERRGAALFRGKGACYDCHGLDLKGDSAIGAPDLTDTVQLYGDGSREALFASIAGGRQGMCPAWVQRMSAAAIRETAVYVWSLSLARTR